MKTLTSLSLTLLFATSSLSACATVPKAVLAVPFTKQTTSLNTPRGANAKIDIYNAGEARALLLAPGSGCGDRFDMYDALAKEAKTNGFTLVRLYWAYCVSDPENGSRSRQLVNEKEDFAAALAYTKDTLGFKDPAIYVGGKSLGTFVSAKSFLKQKSLAGLVLLTPVCTNRRGAKPVNEFESNYEGMSLETRPVLLVQGSADPYCDTNHFQEYLSGKPNNFVSLTVKSGHEFRIVDGEGVKDKARTEKNLKTISQWVFNWLK